MKTKKLSTAQVMALKYYAALVGPKEGRRFRHPDPRPIAALVELGFLNVVGWNYGSLYGITETGKEALVSAEAAEKVKK